MKNYWINSGFYTLLQRGGGLIFGFGGFFLLIRLLSNDDFGAWALFVAVTALIEVARNGLIQNGLIKFSVGATSSETKAIQNAGLFLNVVLTLISCLLLIVIGPTLAALWNFPIIANLFLMYCITTIVLIPFQQFSYLQQSVLDFKSLSIMYLIRQGIFFGMILFNFISDTQLDLLVLSFYLLVASFVASLYGFFSVQSYFHISLKVDWKWVTKLFHYGKYSFGTNASGMLYNSMDQMMLGALMGSAEVAIYNVSTKVNNLLDVPISTMSSIVFPQSSRHSGNMEAIKNMYEKSVAALLIFLIPIVFGSVFFAKLILTILAGTSYSDSSNVLVVVLLFTLFQPFIRQFGTVLDANNKPGLNFIFVIISATINFILNYIFITKFGVIGAAFATLLSLFIASVINLYVLRILYGVSLISIFYQMKSFSHLIFSSLIHFLGKYSYKNVPFENNLIS